MPGIDVAVVGNDDFSLGMGILGQFDSPQYMDAVKAVIAACEKHGVLPGIAGGDPTWVRYWHDQGMRLFWCAADIVSMWNATRAGMAAIKDGLAWLGLDWDGDPISQFERSDRHVEVAEELLSKGAAYRCFATPEELSEMREYAKQQGLPPRYDGRWRDRDPSDAPDGTPFVK